MKIVYVGNFKPDHSTENHLSATLEKLGNEVWAVQEDETSPDRLDYIIKQGGFDLFLFTRTWGQTVTMEHLTQLRKLKVPSVSYHLDLYVGLQRDGGIDTDPFWRTDFVFTPDGNQTAATIFAQKGINHYYMPPGVFEDECYIDVTTGWAHDLVFVGSYNYHPEWPYRQQLISFLGSYGRRFHLFGDHPGRSYRGSALNQLYANTKIVIGDTLSLPGNTHYWSDRVYETLGRGGFLIHPYIKGLEEEFEDQKHLVFYEYGNWNQLADLINYYYINDEIREQIRRSGHEHVKANCTYTNRLKQMFEILEAEGVC